MTGARIFSILLFVGLIALCNVSPALAAGGVCTSPAGNEGDLIYNDDYDIVQYCAGSNIWIKLGGGTVDSRIGTLQNSKWCATNASGIIQCDQSTPSTTLSGGTSGYVGVWSSATTMGLSSTAAGQQLFWDGTNSRLGVGTTITANTVTASLVVDSTSGRMLFRNLGSDGLLIGNDNGGAATIWNMANNILRFGTNNIERMRITGSGQVGIGTTAPAYGLTLNNANTSNTGAMYIGAALNSSGKGLVIDSNTRTTADASVPALEVISRANTSTIVATVGGSVGIGSPTPKNLLDVGGPVTLDPSYATYLVNSYYDGAWRYVGNGVAWGIGNNFGGPADGVSIARAPVNSSGANAALTWTPVFNIDSSNRIGIGTASPTYKLDVNGNVSITEPNATLVLNGTSGNWDGYISFRGSGTEYWHLGAYHPNGAFYLQGAATTDMRVVAGSNSWAASSDKRLKNNIETLHVLDKLGPYRAVSFNWKETGRHDIGVVAQELYKIFPEIVNKGSDGAVLTPGKDGVWSVQYDKLGALALEAVKELKADNDNQEAELRELRAEIKALKASIH